MSDAPTERFEDGGRRTAALPLPGSRIGRYLVLEALGAGGMGVVYLAYDPQLDRRIALKLAHLEQPDSGGVELRLREARALARLAHPNVLAIFDAGIHHGQVYLATERFDGLSLRQWRLIAPRDWRAVLRVMLAAGHGLAAAHASGLVHRDFKPDNVLVGPDDEVKVIDFGLARASADANGEAATSVPASGLTFASGTLGYAAPEQLTAGRVDARADQFAFCATLFEMLAGAAPFPQRALTEYLADVEKGITPTRLATLAGPKALRSLVGRGLEWDPDRRHASLSTLLQALTGLLNRRARGIALASGLGAIAVGVIALGLMPDRIDPCPPAIGTAGWLSAERSERLRARFAESGFAYADDAADRVLAGFSRYRDQLVDAREQACRATHVLGEQSPQLLDLRNVCLDRREDEARSLFALLTEAEAAELTRAVPAVLGLSAVADCARRSDLLELAAEPSDRAARTVIAEARPQMNAARAALLAGRYAEVAAATDGLRPSLNRTGYAPLLAELEFLSARAREELGEHEQANQSYRAAHRAAVAGGDGHLAARSASYLGAMLAITLKRGSEAADWQLLAQAELERTRASGSETELLLLLDRVRVEHDAGRYRESLALAERTLALADRLSEGQESYLRLRARSTLGNTWIHLGEHAKALPIYEALIADSTRLLGAEDPRVGAQWGNLSAIFEGLQRNDEAIAAARKAVSIAVANFGPAHVNSMIALHNLATRLDTGGRDQEALPVYREALAAGEAALGPDNANLVYVLSGMAQLLADAGAMDEARAAAGRALAMAGEAELPADLQIELLTVSARCARAAGQDWSAYASTARELLAEVVDQAVRDQYRENLDALGTAVD